MLRTYPVKGLFDSDATHSFILGGLVETLLLVSTTRHSPLSMTLSDGKVVDYRDLYLDCPIKSIVMTFLVDLYKFELMEFNIILGMDWLSKHQTHIDCLK